MSYTFDELKKKTVSDLRKIASGLDHEELKSYTLLHKEHLLKALCKALNIDMHFHHEVVGLDKSSMKTQIRKLKKRRDEAFSSHNHAELKIVRRKIRMLKKALRKAMI